MLNVHRLTGCLSAQQLTVRQQRKGLKEEEEEAQLRLLSHWGALGLLNDKWARPHESS